MEKKSLESRLILKYDEKCSHKLKFGGWENIENELRVFLMLFPPSAH